MARFDESNAVIFVYTYKDGLLSKVAHDLKLTVAKFQIDIDGDGDRDGGDGDTRRVSARCDPSSLRVACVMRDGKEDGGVLFELEKKTIEKNITDEVLEARRFPDLSFRSTSVEDRGAGTFAVRGLFTLHGQARAISFVVHSDGDRRVAELSLHQPDFGIRPYSAMLGTLKVKADVKVYVSLPAA